MDFLEFDQEDMFSIFEGLETVSSEFFSFNEKTSCLISDKSIGGSNEINEVNDSFIPKCKRQKISATGPFVELGRRGQQQQKMAHVDVERNRRKQMNEHLSILRSLMPCFYVKRGDQASIIGGVVTYITELQQVLQSLEAKKQRKLYSEVLSPKIQSSNSPLISPLKPPLSPRLLINLPISPRTPQSISSNTIINRQQTAGAAYVSPQTTSTTTSSSTMESYVNELAVNSKSAVAEVEVKFTGPNVMIQTVSPRIPGQVFKIISVLESLNLEILQVNISTVDETMLISFTIKIGIDCELSADELAQLIQHTFTVK